MTMTDKAGACSKERPRTNLRKVKCKKQKERQKSDSGWGDEACAHASVQNRNSKMERQSWYQISCCKIAAFCEDHTVHIHMSQSLPV